MENNSTDLIKCSISAKGINGDHSASVEMDLDKKDACNQSDELQVYRVSERFAFQNGKDCTDFSGFTHQGSHVGTMSVTPIEGGLNCQREKNYINAKVLRLTDNFSRDILVQKDILVSDFKEEIYDKLFKDVTSQQRLVYNGQTLQDNKTLASYGIQNGDCIDLTGRLRGG